MKVERAAAGLVNWLEDHAESLMKSAIARRGYATSDRNATAQELKDAKAMAERMTGRKLDLVTASVEDARRNALMNDSIADKLESEALMLSGFASRHSELVAASEAVLAGLDNEFVPRLATVRLRAALEAFARNTIDGG